MARQKQLALVSDGESLRDKGKNQVEENAGEWMLWIRQEAIKHWMEHGVVTSDDIRSIADRQRYQPHHDNAWGAVFRGREWKPIGFVRSKRRDAHARMIREWMYAGYNA